MPVTRFRPPTSQMIREREAATRWHQEERQRQRDEERARRERANEAHRQSVRVGQEEQLRLRFLAAGGGPAEWESQKDAIVPAALREQALHGDPDLVADAKEVSGSATGLYRPR